MQVKTNYAPGTTSLRKIIVSVYDEKKRQRYNSFATALCDGNGNFIRLALPSDY